jgi:hypothetical protein
LIEALCAHFQSLHGTGYKCKETCYGATSLEQKAAPKFLAGSFNEEEKAQENLLMVIKMVCLKVHGIDPDELDGNDELKKELAARLAADENFFIKINWIWYIGGR